MTSELKPVITDNSTGLTIAADTPGRIAIPALAVGSTNYTNLDFAGWTQLIAWAQAQQIAKVGLT